MEKIKKSNTIFLPSRTHDADVPGWILPGYIDYKYLYLPLSKDE